jgi:hypothetical protein
MERWIYIGENHMGISDAEQTEETHPLSESQRLEDNLYWRKESNRYNNSRLQRALNKMLSLILF